MKSVFNTPPPDFSQKEVQNLVENCWISKTPRK